MKNRRCLNRDSFFASLTTELDNLSDVPLDPTLVEQVHSLSQEKNITNVKLPIATR
jgi:hypothetical protein